MTKNNLERAREHIGFTENEFYEFSIDRLKGLYGIENLTIIERFHLRRIVRICMDEQFADYVLMLEGNLDNKSIFEIDAEANSRWLLELYGLRDTDLRDRVAVHDSSHRMIYEGPLADEEYARRKFPEYGICRFISPQMKEYLRIKREKAHLL